MALDFKISFSWTNYCRLCLLDNGIMLPLFEEEGLSRHLRYKIETCLQLVTYDGDPLPRRICHKCLHKINQMFEFRTMALESYEKLKTHLLPLKHVPEVHKYIERADCFQKKVDYESAALAQCSTLTTSSRCDKFGGNQIKIHIKTEKEPIEEPESSPWPATSISHLNSMEQDSPYLSTSYTSTPRRSSVSSNSDAAVSTTTLGHQKEASRVQPDSLKRKRNIAGTDITAPDPSQPSVPQVLEKVKVKKKFVGPASRKRLYQSSQYNCEFCAATFRSGTILRLHLEKCLECPTCHQSFTSVAEKARHEAEAHIVVLMDCDKKHLRKRCSRCPAQFASNVMLTTHSKYDHVLSKSTGPARMETDEILNPVQGMDDRRTMKKYRKSLDHELNCNGLSDCEDDSPLSLLKRTSEPGDSHSSGSHKCLKCHHIFSNQMSFESHVCIPGNSESYSCKICNESFPDAHVLLEHENIHGRYKCPVCDERFNTQQGCNSHRKTHAESGKLANNRKSSEKGGAISKKTATAEKKKSLLCHTCFVEFEEDDVFILHLYRHATEQLDDERIPTKKSRKSLSLGRRVTSADPVQETDSHSEQFSVKCERCHVVCRSKEYYKVHLATHMSKVKTSFPCSGCIQDFRNVEALNRHTCSGKQPENIQTCCLDCGQALVKGEDHVCDNKCPECDKVFKSSRGQRLHFSSKHRGKAPAGDESYDDPQLSPDENQADVEGERIINQQETVPKEGSPPLRARESFGTSDSKVNSLFGVSPPKDRLPPDGAPLDEPVTSQSHQSSDRITSSDLVNGKITKYFAPLVDDVTSASKDINVLPNVCNDSDGGKVQAGEIARKDPNGNKEGGEETAFEDSDNEAHSKEVACDDSDTYEVQEGKSQPGSSTNTNCDTNGTDTDEDLEVR